MRTYVVQVTHFQPTVPTPQDDAVDCTDEIWGVNASTLEGRLLRLRGALRHGGCRTDCDGIIGERLGQGLTCRAARVVRDGARPHAHEQRN
jgi:hypothetical protein